MTTLRRLPGIAIAVVALCLSASLVFAGQPAAAGSGLSKAASHAGKSVPVRGGADNADKEGDETTDEGDGGDNCATDPRTQTAEQLADMTHGSIVCWAAHQETPDGYANHGAWVSSWARGEHGEQAPAKAHGKSAKP